jgi:hypothetical protein
MPMHILFGDWFLFLEENYFKNHLKMYLNVLEKKKEKKRNFSLSFGPEAHFSRAHLFSFGPATFLSLLGRSAFSSD